MDLHALQPGYMLREYRIEKLLGEGGFGLTYLAFDTNLEKKVAIKEYMPSEHSVRKDDSQIVAKNSSSEKIYKWGLNAFLNEAKILAKFEDSNIVRIYRFFEANGTAYIVMEYCEGGCLVDLISKNEPMPEAQLKSIVAAIVHGLQLVHNDGILHRDIKPDNIMFRENGTPVLIDFGAARQAIGNKSIKVTTIITPGYAPLEQYSNKGELGPWSDIYSLAAVAYLCLTGEKPPDIMNRLHEDSIKTLATDSDSSPFLISLDSALQLQVQDRPKNLSEWTQSWQDFDLTPSKQFKSNKALQPIYANKTNDKSDYRIPISARTSAEPFERTRIGMDTMAEHKKSSTSFLRVISISIMTIFLVAAGYLGYQYYLNKSIDIPFFSQAETTNSVKEKLDKELILKVQTQLNLLNYPVPKNGIMDTRTKQSIKDFEEINQLVITGEADAILLDLLIKESTKIDLAAWEHAQELNSKKSYNAYLKQFPKGVYASQVPQTLINLQLKKQKQAQLKIQQEQQTQQQQSDRLKQIAHLKTELNQDIQQQLKRLKYKNLNTDGQLSTATINAIKAYQKLKNSDINGLPTKTLLFQLKTEKTWPGHLLGETFKDCSQCPTMVIIPDGDFMMGSTEGNSNEQPKHHVTIKEFAISQTEITFQQWDSCYADGGCTYQPDDEGLGRQNQAVMNVSYFDAQQYINWLNQITRKTYRLPSETEWEYAARSGSDSAYSWGNYIGINHVNCRSCDKKGGTNVVKTFAANSFGLYDMHGNVWEWIEDCWHANYSGAPSDNESWEPIACNIFVTRGGSSSSPEEDLRAAKRGNMNADKRINSLGFRVALKL